MRTILFYFKFLNEKIIYFQVLVTIIILLMLPLWSNAQTFTAGNLAVIQEANSNNTTGTILELSPNTAGQSVAVNTYSILGTGTNAMRFSGSAATTSYLSTSNDGTLLCFDGANSTNTSSNSNTLNPRGVGTLNNSYTFSLATTYTGTSGNQPRGATTLNNTNYYIADQGGFYSNGTTTASPSGNIRCVKSFGGTVYAFTAVATNASVGIISAATGGTLTALTGLPNGTTNNQDFYLISSGSNGSTYDVLYILAASTATAGTIYKYSLVSGSWTANSSYTTTFGGFGLCAAKNGSGAYLYVTSGLGSTTNNSVIKLTDASGYNTNINITTANNVTLYTATGSVIMKGISFAPKSSSTAPVVSTGTTSNVNITTATCSGNVTSDGGSTILKRGICYNTSANPDTNTNKILISGTTGTFSANLINLNGNTIYHYRAFAQNAIGITYGADSTFQTKPNFNIGSVISVGTNGGIQYWNGSIWIAIASGLPGQSLQFVNGNPLWINNPQGITTTVVSSIIGTTATSGGTILNDGGAFITARGVCWSTSHNPTISDNHTTDSTGIGTFTSNLTGLTSGIYYVRTYATNSVGTAYGNEVSFTLP